MQTGRRGLAVIGDPWRVCRRNGGRHCAARGSAASLAGPAANGATLLPNGWRIAPAGRHIQVGDLPLNMAPSPDGRFLVITNNGWTRPTLTVFDTKHGAGDRPRPGRQRVARSRLGTRRVASLFGGRRREQHLRVRVDQGCAEGCRPHHDRPAGAARGRRVPQRGVHRRSGDRAGRQTVCTRSTCSVRRSAPSIFNRGAR